MKAKITVILIALAIVFMAQIAEARVVKQEQSWLDKIFSNDDADMIQKSPFSQPQERAKNPRLRQPKNDDYSSNEEPRTQGPKAVKEDPRRKLGRHAASNNPQSELYSQRMQNIRQQRLNALNRQGIAQPSSSVND